MPSILQRTARILLVIQGLGNIAQGLYCISKPAAYAAAAGPGFASSSAQAIQAIGLGSLGMGLYGAAGAYSNHRSFFVLTAAMRIVFGVVVISQWGMDENWGVALYEWSVALLALFAIKE